MTLRYKGELEYEFKLAVGEALFLCRLVEDASRDKNLPEGIRQAAKEIRKRLDIFIGDYVGDC